ncbi:MAG: sulfate adenylyltransferase [Planctomycetales bacterium]|nr:sulfate adenylyltransferase [Planctomycetales bacterium]
MSNLIPPHGGNLISRIVPAAKAPRLRERAGRLPSLALDAREIADLELIATGAASPLVGFLGEADYRSVVEQLRLADGTVWPLPLTLAVPEAARGEVAPGREVALRDGGGRLWGLLHVSDLFRRDPLEEARLVYRTEDPSHPGVAYLLGRPEWLAGGTVDVPPLPSDLPFASRRLSPRALRGVIGARGWRRVAGFQTRNPIHRAHEHLTKLALEFADGLVIHPLVGETKGDDIPADVRFRAYEALLDRHYPKERVILAAFPAAMRYAGPREALFHALVRKNYGITHLIVGRDHAGVGKFYGPTEAQEIFDRFTREEIGVEPLRFEPTFFCRACESLASSRTCPHEAAERLELSGTRVREILRSGGALPREFTRPEVAQVLRDFYGAGAATAAPGEEADVTTTATTPTNGRRGFILWFTGLSGAGKSTLARAISPFLEEERAVEILDGDEVRTHLSKGLGFSREDRDTNIRRIGFVARLLARNGGVAVTAAISPYSDTRAEVRRAAEAEGVPFVEVFADAPLDALARRDPKGLYKRAIEGEIAHFTGVSDPYEPPRSPDVHVRTDRETVEESVGKVLALLRERGLVRGESRVPGPRSLVHSPDATPVFPTFLRFSGRRALVVGGGRVAEGKVAGLLAAGARVTVVAPEVRPGLERPGVEILRRPFAPRDLDGAWFVVAAATPEVNRAVVAAAEERQLFVNSVDDREGGSAYAGGVLRREGITVAISTGGEAPALAGLLREGLDAVVPRDIGSWLEQARSLRAGWQEQGVPHPERRPLLLEAINGLYSKEGSA